MIRYTCDICNKTLPDNYTRTFGPPTALQAYCGITDLCPSCRSAESKIDGPKLLIDIWKKKTRGQTTHKSTTAQSPASPPSKGSESAQFHGRGCHEKAKIYESLLAYRRSNGLGCLTELASRADVKVDVLRDMIDAKPVPMAIWEKVGKVLDNLSAKPEKKKETRKETTQNG